MAQICRLSVREYTFNFPRSGSYRKGCCNRSFFGMKICYNIFQKFLSEKCSVFLEENILLLPNIQITVISFANMKIFPGLGEKRKICVIIFVCFL